VRSAEPVPSGIFYAETFVDLPAERDVLLAVQGSYRVSIDDTVVLDRDTRVWGEVGKLLLQSSHAHPHAVRTHAGEERVFLLQLGGQCDQGGIGYVRFALELGHLVLGGGYLPADGGNIVGRLPDQRLGLSFELPAFQCLELLSGSIHRMLDLFELITTTL